MSCGGSRLMAERRRYTHRQKAEAVGLSVVKGTLPAAEELGIPESSLRYWRERPEFASLREQKREDVAADVWAAFQTGVRRVVELIPQTEDLQKVAIATGVLYDKAALMSGHATERTEQRDVTDRLDDHESEALRDVLDKALAE